jgi:phosphatidylglycerol:prolipoprotein diacylglycerol transferase
MIALFPSRQVALDLGSLHVHWYGLLYVSALCLAWWLLPRLQHYRLLVVTRQQWLELITWALAGVLLGGRLGYVFFYEPSFFWQHPEQIFALWAGGMSAHGGIIGVAIALWVGCRQLHINYLRLLDVVVVPAALGLALGRVGNWINQELFIATTAHVLVIAKDVLLAGVVYVFLRRCTTPGSATAAFLLGYGLLRFGSEYLRIQTVEGVLGLTRGQVLTIPAFIVGLVLAYIVYRNAERVA